jgi:WHG domain-containing protein
MTLHHEASRSQFSVDEVLSYSSRWDKRIAIDLVGEMESLFGEKITTLPQMRNILAVKGYRGLARRIARDVEGKIGPDALHAMADAMRNFALEHPGLSAATFRNAASNASDWLEASTELFRIAHQVFVQVDIRGEEAQEALRILRSLVRGFVMSEMSASFFAEPSEYQHAFDRGIDVFISGLPALQSPRLRGTT